jgi:histidinol-phosphate aminotransferase
MMNLQGLKVNHNLLGVPLYIAGRSSQEVREEFGLDEVIKLASNENPLGPSPLATEALKNSVDQSHRYPGIAEKQLKRALAENIGHGLSEENFIIGNGATDILRMIAQAFIFDGGESVMSRVTFPMYWIFTGMFGGKITKVEPGDDFQIDLDGVLSAINHNTRIAWICSPNNPTGLVLKQKDFDAFMASVPSHVLVVFDESYVNFVEEPEMAKSLSYVSSGKNLIALRSFSKSGGLANLRVGYGIAYPDLIQYLHHTRLPFNTGALSLSAAAASLEDKAFIQESRKIVLEERHYLYEQITDLGLKCLPSQANFLMIYDLPAEDAYFADEMMKRGVIVRGMTAFGQPGAIRVTAGTHKQNETFISALKNILEQIRIGA